MNDLLKKWNERLEFFKNHPEVAKGMVSTVAMGVQQGRIVTLQECIQELENFKDHL